MFTAVSIFALTSLLDLSYNKIKVNYMTDTADITLRPRSCLPLVNHLECIPY